MSVVTPRVLLIVLASAFAGVAAWVGSARAEPAGAASSDEEARARARAAFEKGAALAADSRWGDALEQFEQSAALVPHATTTYNIGYCERALGRSTRAKKSFSRALTQDTAHGGTELSTDLRAATTKYIQEMNARIATPTLTIVPEDATVTIDGAPLELADDGKRLLAGTRPPGTGERIPTSFASTAKTGRRCVR